jgi:transposase-like protein
MSSISAMSAPYLHDEGAAFAHLESILWPEGPVCPHCGSVSGKHYDLRKTRVGLRKCSECRKQFTVKVGSVFESAHIPLHKMLQAVYLICSSKKGISSHQLHRILGIQYNSAWFLTHRIREAFRSGELAPAVQAALSKQTKRLSVAGKVRLNVAATATKMRFYLLLTVTTGRFALSISMGPVRLT